MDAVSLGMIKDPSEIWDLKTKKMGNLMEDTLDYVRIVSIKVIKIIYLQTRRKKEK